MSSYTFVTAISVDSAPIEDAERVQFATAVSSVDFSYAKGEVVEMKSIESEQLRAWESLGVVIAYVDPATAKCIASFKAGDVVVADDLPPSLDVDTLVSLDVLEICEEAKKKAKKNAKKA